MTQTKLSVLIVGCGNIAGGFDLGRIHETPFTHAGAYRRHGSFTLDACVEPNAAKRDAFMSAWSVPFGYATLAEAIADGINYDVISICSPTACHANDLLLALHMRPRLIFCEKPVTTSVKKTSELVERCEKQGIPLAINHNRRWDPAIARLREEIRSGLRGELRSVVGFYNKGVLNNGSHLFDLLHYLLGELSLLTVGEAVIDYLPEDPTIPAWLTAGKVPIFLACGDARDYALFELQLIFSSGMVAIEDGGQSWRERRAGNSKVFKGYRTLQTGQEFVGQDGKSMLAAVDNIHRHLNQGDIIASTGRTALKAQILCEQVRDMAIVFEARNPPSPPFSKGGRGDFLSDTPPSP